MVYKTALLTMNRNINTKSRLLNRQFPPSIMPSLISVVALLGALSTTTLAMPAEAEFAKLLVRLINSIPAVHATTVPSVTSMYYLLLHQFPSNLILRRLLALATSNVQLLATASILAAGRVCLVRIYVPLWLLATRDSTTVNARLSTISLFAGERLWSARTGPLRW